MARIAHLLPPDPGHAALKGAVRMAVVTTALFAFGDAVVENSQVALFGAFGAIALMIFAQFDGPPLRRLRAYVGLAVAGFPLIALGTLCSQDPWIAGGAMAVVAFVVLFAGIVSGYVAAAANAALLAFILPVMIAAPASEIPDRLAGWALAAVVAISAVMLVWPDRPRDQVRRDLATALRAVADSVASLSYTSTARRSAVDEEAGKAIATLRESFTSMPYRPSGATGPTAALSRLIADVSWLRPLIHTLPGGGGGGSRFASASTRIQGAAEAVLRASAATLERGSERPDVDGMDRIREDTSEEFGAEITAAIRRGDDTALARGLEEAFRLRALSYGTWQIGVDALIAAGQPAPEPDLPTLAAATHGEGHLARAVAGARILLRGHLTTESVWFRNSLRGAAGLGLAVLVGQLAELQHGFWVVLGTLSVLRSNALGTGSTIIRALAGTTVGILIGGALVALIGEDEAVLWATVPLALAVAGYAPRAISFAAGQAAFTVAILVLFDLISPVGWSTGLVRVEDIAIGCAISLGVGTLFWPRGAAAVVRKSIASSYARCAEYVGTTVQAMLDGDRAQDAEDAAREALAARVRLDDALFQYLGERSAGRLPLDSLGLLAAGSTRLRRVGDQLRSSHTLFRLRPVTDPSPALAESRAALEVQVEAMRAWYVALGDSVLASASPPRPEERGEEGSRILRWVRHAAQGSGDELPPGLAIAWAGEHIDLLRELEAPLAEAASDLA